jgi:hypothetical protein
MSQWWTYSLSDLLMFSAKTYYRLLELYNRDIWPAQLAGAACALGVLFCTTRRGRPAARVAAALLAASWLWVGWAYHAERYATINTAAPGFAAAFVVEALLLLWLGTVRGRLAIAPLRDGVRRPALGLLAFALLGYPLLAAANGRPWLQMEMFAVAPDPTALATLGVLALTRPLLPLLWPIPLLWCFISGATLWTMHAPDFWIAPMAALLALRLAWSARAARSSVEI